MNEQNEPTTLKRKQHKNISKDSTSHSPKKIKTQNDNVAAKVINTSRITSEAPKQNEDTHPKSKKELRAEKKALKKAAAVASTSEKTSEKPTELSREEKKLLGKENSKIIKKEQRLLFIKEERKAKTLRKQKRLRMEMNAKGGKNAAQLKKLKRNNKDQSNSDSQEKKDKESAMNVYNNLFNGTHDDTTGTTSLRMGVKYIDVVEGKGDRVAEEGILVNVSYKLKAGKFGAVIDSSKNFSFRLGKREVITGWDIGVVGMREGGRRHLIVPPKAGYGSEDIGAGPGAVLFFDITLISMR